MGINFHVKDHKCEATWSYTGFNNFRKKIAQSLGLNLEVDSDGNWINQDWENWDKYWLLFLTHSDCSGKFTPHQCGKISEKLESIIHIFENEDFLSKYNFDNCKTLIIAMKYCKDNRKYMRVS